MKIAWLILIAMPLAYPQTRVPASVFPSDTRPAAQADASLLEAVCPGHVAGGAAITCKTECPRYTGFGATQLPGVQWSDVYVNRGHFLSPASDDAVLWMAGCEPHSDNFGGSILLTRKDGQWSMLWYKPGVQTAECHKIALSNGRDILVCYGVTGGQGFMQTELYVEDLLKPVATLMAEGGPPFFSAGDTTGTCGDNPENPAKPANVVHASVEKVEFLPRIVGGAPVIAVNASYGTRQTTPAQVQACLTGKIANIAPATAYRIEYEFDGSNYRPTLATAAAAKPFTPDAQ